jgi:hypothetical protein
MSRGRGLSRLQPWPAQHVLHDLLYRHLPAWTFGTSMTCRPTAVFGVTASLTDCTRSRRPGRRAPCGRSCAAPVVAVGPRIPASPSPVNLCFRLCFRFDLRCSEPHPSRSLLASNEANRRHGRSGHRPTRRTVVPLSRATISGTRVRRARSAGEQRHPKKPAASIVTASTVSHGRQELELAPRPEP